MRSFIGEVPASVVAFMAATIIALFASDRVARWLRTRRLVAFLLLLGFGLVLSATLVPTAQALQGEASDGGTCDFSRLGLAPMIELTRVNYTSLNVLLFVPLGIAVGLLPRNRPAAVVAIAALSLTFVVEGLQLLLPVLGRGCQSADMVDNLLGLAIGVLCGLLARSILPRRYREPDRFGS